MTKAKSREEVIEIPAIQRETIVLKISGTAPLLWNKFAESDLKSIERKQQGLSSEQRQPRKPLEEMEEHIHRLPDGRASVPSTAVKTAMATALYRNGMADNIISNLGRFRIPEEYLPIIGDEPILDRRWGRPQMGTTTLVYRPRWEHWEIIVPIVYIKGIMTAERITQMLNLAGETVGIGAFRVERKGNFGTFEVVSD